MKEIDSTFISIASELGGRVYEVGGCVRDAVLGLKPKDKDVMFTNIPQDKLLEALSKEGDVDLVGKSFGVIKFRRDGTVYDVTVPRKDRYFGYGHTDVAITVDHTIPIEEDLRRRDFTMNAMARDLVTGDILDPYDGLSAIKRKLLQVVTDNSFTEDPLRMLRAMQFCARFGFKLSVGSQCAIGKSNHLVSYVSPERVAVELVKMFKADVPSVGLDFMREYGLLKPILPEIETLIGVPQPKKWHIYDVYNHSKYAMDRIPWKNKVYLRFAALIHDIGKPATFTDTNGEIHFYGHQQVGADMAVGMLSRLRLGTVDGLYFPEELVVQLVREHMFECNAGSPDRVIRRFIGKLTKPGAMDQIRLRIGDQLGGQLAAGRDMSTWVEFAKRVRTLSAPKKSVFGLKSLKINGKDILGLGEEPGPVVGKVLNKILEIVIESPEMNDKETLLTLAKEFLESAEFMALKIGDNSGTNRISKPSNTECTTTQSTGTQDS